MPARRATVSKIVGVALCMLAPNVAAAQIATVEDLVQTEIAACTELALNQRVDILDLFTWPATCVEKVHELCTTALLNDGNVTSYQDRNSTCLKLEQTNLNEAADALSEKLRERWQSCNVREQVKTVMIARIDRLETSIIEKTAADCDYHYAQWMAFDKPSTAAIRLENCLLAAEAVRAHHFHELLLADAGCGNPE